MDDLAEKIMRTKNAIASANALMTEAADLISDLLEERAQRIAEDDAAEVLVIDKQLSIARLVAQEAVTAAVSAQEVLDSFIAMAQKERA